MSTSGSESGTLLAHFETLEDLRVEYLVEHRLLDIVALTICAVICGADSWVEIEAYGQSKVDWLKRFLALPNGIPSHDTISRLFAVLDPDQLQDCFTRWIKSIAQLSDGEVVAIDGKSVRRSYDQGKGKGAIHMVSAWASQNRLVLGQVKVDSKSNEITAIPGYCTKMLSNCLTGPIRLSSKTFLTSIIRPWRRGMVVSRFAVTGCLSQSSI